MAADSSTADQEPPIDHCIRLHGPWQASLIRSDAGFEIGHTPTPKAKLRIPGDWDDWLGSRFRGLVRLERAFGLPTGLTADQEIFLVIESVDFCANIYVNDGHVGELQLDHPPFRRSVGNRLQVRNRLRLEVELPMHAQRGARANLAGGLIGEVRLEITV